MSKIVLDCQKCGGTLQITEDMELFKCEYCGMPYLVERTGEGVRITQLEARVTKVEKEQEQARLGLLESRILEVRSKIEIVYEELSPLDIGKARKQFRESSAQRLYQEELGLRREYVKLGGSDPDILGFVNIVEVIQLLRRDQPKWKLKIGLDGERTPLFGSSVYCPGVRVNFFLSHEPFISVQRQSNEIKVRMHRQCKKQYIDLLQRRYPNRLVK